MWATFTISLCPLRSISDSPIFSSSCFCWFLIYCLSFFRCSGLHHLWNERSVKTRRFAFAKSVRVRVRNLSFRATKNWRIISRYSGDFVSAFSATTVEFMIRSSFHFCFLFLCWDDTSCVLGSSTIGKSLFDTAFKLDAGLRDDRKVWRRQFAPLELLMLVRLVALQSRHGFETLVTYITRESFHYSHKKDNAICDL